MPVSPKISVTPIPIRMITLATERLFTSSWTKVTMTSFLGVLVGVSSRSHHKREPAGAPVPFLAAEEALSLFRWMFPLTQSNGTAPSLSRVAQPPGSPGGGLAGGCSTAHLNLSDVLG